MLSLALVALALSARAEEPLWSEVSIDGEWVRVEVSFAVPASRAQVWEVLTDYQHMASFISNVAVSKVISRNGSVLQIFQSGKAQRGILEFPFEVLREVHLSPMHLIESHMITGSMKYQDGVTEITDEGGETRVVFHGASIPGVWIPPVVGKSFIETEIREQYKEVEAEILRRTAVASSGRARSE
jgi:hypothetical protein